MFSFELWNNYDDIVVEFSMNKNPYLYAENNLCDYCTNI